MRNRIGLIIVALIVSIAAIFLVQRQLDQQPAPIVQAPPEIETVEVLVASQPLFFGAKIEKPQVKMVQYPKDHLPSGIFTDLEAFFEEEDSRTALRAIAVNEIILASKVSGAGGRLSVSGLIETGKRAAAIRVNDIVGVGGFVLPGDRVDVLLTRDIDREGSDNDEKITDVILQNIRVLGVDQDANEAREAPGVARSFTVEVDVRQAQKLALAQRVGNLSLALRDLENTEPMAARRITVADLKLDQMDGVTTVPPVALASARKAAPRRRVVSRDTTVKIFRDFAGTSYKVRKQGNVTLAGGPRATITSMALPGFSPSATAVPVVPDTPYVPSPSRVTSDDLKSGDGD